MRAMVFAISFAIAVMAWAADAPERKAPTTAPSSTSTQVLKHHDGKAEGHKSYGGSGHMIEFTMPEGFNTVNAVAIHGSRYGAAQPPAEDFAVHILDETHTQVLHTHNAPYRIFLRGADRWNLVKLAKPVAVSGTFWVALDFKATQTKGVYVSYDTSTAGEHSLAGLPEGEAEGIEYDWMIQVTVGR